MVLLFSVEDPKHQRQVKGGTAYVWSTFEDHVAVIYNDQKSAQPTAEEIRNALEVVRYPVPPRFFVSPYNGVVWDGNDDVEATALQWIFEDITQCVQRRENVTVVHRGANAEAHLEPLLINFLNAVRSSAEYGMQVVADEFAKEKQMQRLLRMSVVGFSGDGGDRAEDESVKALNASQSNEGGVRLSNELRRRIAKLRQEYRYAHPADRRAAAESRYGIISAAHNELLEPPVNDSHSLTPQTFVAAPPMQRTSQASRSASYSAAKNTRSHTVLFNQLQRRNTALLLSDLNKTVEGASCEPIAGNGWGEKITTYAFDGTSSVMALPGIPNFDEVIRAFTIDFWIRTDLKVADGKRVLIQVMEGQREDLGQLFQVSLNWYEDMPDSVRVVLRDSANRVMEAVASVAKTGLTSGDHFHHLMVRVDSIEEGQLTCEVDAKAIDVQLVQQEHPIAFNPWPHRLFIGGFLDEENTPAMVFRGTIAELRVWSGGDPAHPIVRWPLLVSDSAALPEVTHTIPADHRETLLNLHAVEERAPRSAPSFDGRLVMNVGTLPLFGQLMHNWRMEFRFRTDVSSCMMTLVGVTDGRFKMQEFGIVLNAEPVASKDRFRYHELHTTFYIIDAFGVCCSALLRGTERHNLVDGEWHTLVWRCIDSEANKFTVKVDDALQDLLFVCREGPTRFITFENWIAVGGHNVRNWKVQRPFLGQIGRFYLSLRGSPYVTLQMNEGPGAYVMQDYSCHNNHGLLINSDTNVVRRNDVMWIPAPSDQADERATTTERDVRIFVHNRVSIAAVVFTCSFGEKGAAHESIYDIYSKEFYELTSMPHYLSQSSGVQWKSWYDLPEDCYHVLDSITRLEESINAVISADAPRGHLMITVRIGDCRATVLHFREPELPDDAAYDCNMLKWHYPYMVEGMQGRRELMLNRMIEGAESVLLSNTLKPSVTAKLGPLNARNKTVVTDDIIRSLQNSGRPWYLPVVLHSRLLNAEFGSSLHLLHRVYPRMSGDEAAAVSLFNKRLIDGVRENASLLIQRNWRGHVAKHEAKKRSAQRFENDRKVEEIRGLRMNAVVKPKQQLGALLVTLHHPQCCGVPPIDNDVSALEEALRQQGYEVTRLEDPDVATLLKAVTQIDTSKLNFIYLSGYGGALNLRQPPVLGFESLAICVEEQARRTELECDATATYQQLLAQMKKEAESVPAKKSKKRGKDKKAAAPPTRPKRQTEDEIELERRRIETALRTSRQQLEQEEAFARDGLVQEYEEMNQLLSREMRQAIVVTREYEQRYRAKGPEGDLQNFIYPCESPLVEPYASTTVDVEDFVCAALHRQAPPLGLQCIVAVDLQPLTPFSCGMACLASSTGNTFRFPYEPQQRNLLSHILVKAFNGQLPKISSGSKYAVLSGGIQTADNQRDWKSFATYVVSKMQQYCTPARFRTLRNELDRHLPFVADLVPVRDILLTAEAKDHRRRERETQKAKAVFTFGVGSSKVQSDMFSLFRAFMDGITISELSFTNTIRLLFLRHNAGIDGINSEDVFAALEKCRPHGCAILLHINVSACGVEVQFECRDPSDRVHLTQWLNGIVMRSLTWQFRQRPLYGTAPLEMDFVEYIYDVKISCSGRRYRQLCKQFDAFPIPQQYVRCLSTRLLKSK
ncbi:hypothetical protein ABB37_07053 [Leptomonas pyrrhocoris]|uniref:Uncharacterized protein n=1 Tax=Leptomonas pyrrhocoris TaxID=157538 RepID=A0A0N0DTP7_LEPPY|nr:hypothetical protein ABB37_07053 [Leptomonas pyrrhocoris]XP_015656174.1 hypothetical protein ABB37_07053 [Leptomonas pyrrhocoris]KPA77734.1 hypothetical protein ABB37_07053 [Leptomonas pyrrhocoris]KPA77735.1 hypothetical protein ABB37_07053 [Leptomonas pyrrhocoris]|eukprot:XP_015656173.1 hypothetical protein ABB37_07053 [Leptomonas pyrrhocoris]